MNALETFYKTLDQSDWDAGQEAEINVKLLQITEILMTEGLSEAQHFAEVDREVFLFNASPERTRSYKPIGSSPNKEFDHLLKRFKETKNVYVKTEYGLAFYYSRKEHDSLFLIELLGTLFILLKSYIDKLKPIEDKNPLVITYIRPLLTSIFQIANNHKDVEKIGDFYKEFIKYLYDAHQNWDIKHHSAIVIFMIITDLANDHYASFIQYVDITKILAKNWIAAEYFATIDAREPLYIIDPTLKLCNKANINNTAWLNFEATQYEKMSAILLENSKIMVAVSFIEKALTIYKEIKNEGSINRLETQYQKLRDNIELKDIPFEIPIEESQRINQLIKKQVQDQSTDEIIRTLIYTPMLPPLSEIKKESEERLRSSTFLNIFHTIIYDKIGNVIDQLNGKNKEEFALNWVYSFHMQIALQTIVHFFTEAFFADKISADSIVNYLKTTWIGSDRNKNFHGKTVSINYLKLVESGIQIFFRELKEWKNQSELDFICATDSLVLKTEYLLREICSFIDVPTFQQKRNGNGIVEEKTLSRILDNLENRIPENDHFFFKFILIEKGGYNLRNRIAHGLMDNIEYGLQYPILTLIIILKLSNYDLIKN